MRWGSDPHVLSLTGKSGSLSKEPEGSRRSLMPGVFPIPPETNLVCFLPEFQVSPVLSVCLSVLLYIGYYSYMGTVLLYLLLMGVPE